ncbi:MAG: DUF177 domain-containing protein [Phaeospirillum sp.]|nr:DUF177 domain-containing protein [Phaeospirillum sp.]
MTHEQLVTPEFSRPLLVDQLPAKVSRHSIEAEPGECTALAERLGLIEVKSLSAKVEAQPLARSGFIRVNGRLTARVVQTCVVTLVPLEVTVEDAFELIFAPPEAILDEEEEIELSWEQQDPPDPIIDGCIDIGEVVVEHLALALDPFPRAPDAVFKPLPEAQEAGDGRVNPFAVLSSLRQKKE